MSLPRSGAWHLATLGAVALLAACATAGPKPQVTPTAAVEVPATPTPGTPDFAIPQTKSTLVDDSRALAPIHSSRPAQSQPSATVSQEALPESESRPGTSTSPRLPTAEDLGPNYFELFAVTSESTVSVEGFDLINHAVVAFGFSERAKLRNERIDRDGPLAAVARVSRHSSIESAVRFAAAGAAADRPDMPATGGAAHWLGLIAELKRFPMSSHAIAPDLTATRTLQTGWFAALDGDRVPTVVEQWTAVRARTVLTVVLVWGQHVTDGWGRSLIQRLVQTAAKPGAPLAP